MTAGARIDLPSSICTTGIKPQIMTGILLQLLRSQFSREETIQEPALKECLWVGSPPEYVQEDPSRSKIMIEPVFRWDARIVQQRPAILVKRGTWSPQLRGIGQNVYQPRSLDPDDLPENGERYLTNIVGTHMLFCVAQEGAQAELLGTEVYERQITFSKMFIQDFGLSSYWVPQISDVKKLNESKEHFAVIVNLQYTVPMPYRITQQAPLFKGPHIAGETEL